MFFLFLLLNLADADMYCPVQKDWNAGGSNIQWKGNGFTMTGPGGIHGKATFNLLNGYVQFDMDTSSAQPAVNNNFYTSSPWQGLFPQYCDIQKNKSPMCMEMDIVENNGNCASQTTWHTWSNKNGGCDQNGCEGHRFINGRRTYKAAFSGDGWMTVSINGQAVDINNPTPSGNAKDYVKQQMEKIGVQFHSTQWVGWVPQENSCPNGGNVNWSKYSVSNIQISGTLVQGTAPTRCNDLPKKFLESTMNSTRADVSHKKQHVKRWK